MSAQPSFHQAQDKLTFLLALVPYLEAHPGVSATAAAAHFSVEVTTIRDALSLIVVSGIPGDTNNYQHGDLFDIDWDALELRDEIILTQLVAIDDSPRFSAREAAALIAGLQYLQSLPDYADSATVSRLSAALSRGTIDAPSQIAVARASNTDHAMADIRAALAAGVQLEFDYVSSAGVSERRRVDALRIDSTNDDWYLRAWDHLREAVRTFRLDRMSALRLTDTPLVHHRGDVSLPDTLFVTSASDMTVLLEFSPQAVSLLGEFVPEGTKVTRVNGLDRASIRVAHFHSLKRLVTELSGVVRVLEPAEARAAVRDWAAAAAAQYPDLLGR